MELIEKVLTKNIQMSLVGIYIMSQTTMIIENPTNRGIGFVYLVIQIYNGNNRKVSNSLDWYWISEILILHKIIKNNPYKRWGSGVSRT